MLRGSKLEKSYRKDSKGKTPKEKHQRKDTKGRILKEGYYGSGS